ncbi:MAG: FprA family A-type flavoprotein [Candidatus Wallbacteria bacterium]|nr:FprA family A-type flavoprotein [Candidatus Wallbacteria bacterium]
MNGAYSAIRVTERVYWVGARDWAVRNFHGYETDRGTTYNAYLVMGDKPILIDTVKAQFFPEMMARITSVTDPGNIRYIISNHAEMDHSGALPQTIAAVKPEAVYASALGVKALSEHFHLKEEIRAVRNGEKLCLGNQEFSFLETRMLHWPDSMVSYLSGDGILFSQDGFGMHLCSTELYADELPKDILYHEASKYFANILMPYSGLVKKLVSDLPNLGLHISMLAPDHGPVWRRLEDISYIIGLWGNWSLQKPSRKAVIFYDTMWGSTASMASAISEGLIEGGCSVKLMPLQSCHRSSVAAELLEAGALLAGSPTINNGIFPSVADVMTYLKGLKPQNKVGTSFGSYGWGGEAAGQLSEFLKCMNLEQAGEPLKVKYVPDQTALRLCRELGSKIALALQKKCSP